MSATDTITPRLLTRQQAAAYCQVSAERFAARCPVVPVKMGENARSYRWDRKALDHWLDSLGNETAPDGRSWLDRMGDADEGHRARR